MRQIDCDILYQNTGGIFSISTIHEWNMIEVWSKYCNNHSNLKENKRKNTQSEYVSQNARKHKWENNVTEEKLTKTKFHIVCDDCWWKKSNKTASSIIRRENVFDVTS